jgi:hypothetical protein
LIEIDERVPGNYTLLDHAIARTERGLSGILSVEGAPNPDIFNGKGDAGHGALTVAAFAAAAYQPQTARPGMWRNGNAPGGLFCASPRKHGLSVDRSPAND